MEKPGDVPPSGLVRDRLKPICLNGFLALSAAKQQRIEPDQTPVLDILNPPVEAEMGAPALEPLIIDGLMSVAGVADIMVAGRRAKPHSQPAQQLGAIAPVPFDTGAIHSDVAGMDDEVGALLGDPAGERRSIVGEMRLARAQMGVRDLNYPHGSSWR